MRSRSRLRHADPPRSGLSLRAAPSSRGGAGRVAAPPHGHTGEPGLLDFPCAGPTSPPAGNRTRPGMSGGELEQKRIASDRRTAAQQRFSPVATIWPSRILRIPPAGCDHSRGEPRHVTDRHPSRIPTRPPRKPLDKTGQPLAIANIEVSTSQSDSLHGDDTFRRFGSNMSTDAAQSTGDEMDRAVAYTAAENCRLASGPSHAPVRFNI